MLRALGHTQPRSGRPTSGPKPGVRLVTDDTIGTVRLGQTEKVLLRMRTALQQAPMGVQELSPRGRLQAVDERRRPLLEQPFVQESKTGHR